MVKTIKRYKVSFGFQWVKIHTFFPFTQPLYYLAFEDQRAFWTVALCFMAEEDGCMSTFKGIFLVVSVSVNTTKNGTHLNPDIYWEREVSELWLCFFLLGKKCSCTFFFLFSKTDHFTAPIPLMILTCLCVSPPVLPHYPHEPFSDASSSVTNLARDGRNFDSTLPLVARLCTTRYQAPAVQSTEDAAMNRKMFITPELSDMYIVSCCNSA